MQELAPILPRRRFEAVGIAMKKRMAATLPRGPPSVKLRALLGTYRRIEKRKGVARRPERNWVWGRAGRERSDPGR